MSATMLDPVVHTMDPVEATRQIKEIIADGLQRFDRGEYDTKQWCVSRGKAVCRTDDAESLMLVPGTSYPIMGLIGIRVDDNKMANLLIELLRAEGLNMHTVNYGATMGNAGFPIYTADGVLTRGQVIYALVHFKEATAHA